MRRIEVRLPGQIDWVHCQVHVCHAVQITSNGDLVVMHVVEMPLGQNSDGQMVTQTKLQHAYAAGEWAQFRDAGEEPGMLPGEKAN